MQMSNNQLNETKVCLVGSASTGKSQVTNVYVDGNDFYEKIKPTIGAANHRMIDHYDRVLDVLDTSGREEFSDIIPLYLRGRSFVLLFYCICDSKSFASLDFWLKLIRKNGSNDCEIVLVGNKSDLEDEREVSREKAEEFAHKHGIRHFEVSAKTREECSAPFDYCTERFNDRFFHSHEFMPFIKGGTAFELPFEKGVLSIGEKKYRQWIDKSYPNPVELQEGRIDELVKYCNSDSIPHCIWDVQKLHNEILYWNSAKVVQKSLSRGEFNIDEDLFLIRRGEKYCVNREQFCRTSKLLCKYVSNAKGASIVFLEIAGDDFSNLVFDIFVEFHRMSDYIIPFDVFDEFERFCVFYECDCILKHLSYHRIDSIIQNLLKKDIEDIGLFQSSLSYNNIVSFLSKDCKYLFRHDYFFKLGVNLHFLIFSNDSLHETKPSTESKKNIDSSDFIFFLNSLLGYHGICCFNLLGYLVYSNFESPHIFDIFKKSFSKSSILMNLFSSMKSHSKQIQERSQKIKRR